MRLESDAPFFVFCEFLKVQWTRNSSEILARYAFPARSTVMHPCRQTVPSQFIHNFLHFNSRTLLFKPITPVRTQPRGFAAGILTLKHGFAFVR